MLVSDFQYDLPPRLIAQQPLPDRAGSWMLCLNRLNADGSRMGWQDRMFREFPSLLRSDDLLVLNNTRVFPARLYGLRSGRREASSANPENSAARVFRQGRIEVLLTRQTADDPNEWECLVRPGRKIGVGEKLYFGSLYRLGSSPEDESLVDESIEEESVELEAEVMERGSFGERRIRFAPVPDFFTRIERIGHVPLPPYIRRNDDNNKNNNGARVTDRERYQTVYAQARGSVAAPTAGLHFTPGILEQIRGRGIEIAEVTLHVGLGTFQPIRVDKVEDHRLHREWYEIPADAATAINRAKTEGRRVVAIGTTTVRTLEYAAQLCEGHSGKKHVEGGRGEADAFIYPGYRFRIVDALLTNFHLPQSTLLMLVCALGGKDLVMEAYRHAVATGYRFYSYGDCMFVE